MIRPEEPVDEAARMDALRRLDILDTAPEAAYDDLLRIAATICGTPMGTVSLIDSHRQWFKAAIGLEGTEAPRPDTFCAHAILRPGEMMLVPDARDDVRFHDNPFVTGAPNLRFYAGAPLVTSDGHAVGTFCVMDRAPRQLEDDQVQALQALSRQASKLLELRRVGRELGEQLRERHWYEDRLVAYQHELEAANADLAEQTRTDPLTGLSNRRAFAVQLAAAMEVERGARRGLHVAVLDIDHFKVVNDVHGHPEGDRVLQEIASTLRGFDASRGRIARYGGEEFVMLLPDMDAQRAGLQCEYIREAVAAMRIGPPLTVSIGLASHRGGDSAETLFARADQALYEAKRQGRDRVAAIG